MDRRETLDTYLLRHALWCLGMPPYYFCWPSPRLLQSGHANTWTRNSQLAKLTPDQMEKMKNFAVRKPSENKRSITTIGLPALGLNSLVEGMVRALVENTGV